MGGALSCGILPQWVLAPPEAERKEVAHSILIPELMTDHQLAQGTTQRTFCW